MSYRDSLSSGGSSRPASVHSSSSLCRSTSFNSSSAQPSPTSPTTQPILGQLFRSPKSGRKACAGLLGLNPKVLTHLKVPKVPHPSRTLAIFDSVKRGVRECIGATEDDVTQLRQSEDTSPNSSSSQAKILEFEKQIRAAERYNKRLEFHLAKLEELEEQYTLHLQLREGVRNMVRAYSSHTGTNKKESLVNAKCGYKECTQTLCVLEAQLEKLLGTFHCKMRGLLGFARLMPGDVYEVSLKHGQQKWKSRGRIGNNSQSWDSDTAVVKALNGEMLLIKAVEVKMLGKHVTLGQKTCETTGLFSSHPQVMTVSINSHGTIKLSILISWNPLEGVENGTMCELLTPQSTPGRRRFVNSQSMIEGQLASQVMDGSSLSGLRLTESTSHPSVLNRHSVATYPPPSPSTSVSDSELSASHLGLLRHPPPLYHPHSLGSRTGYSSHPHPSPHDARPNSVAVMDAISEKSPYRSRPPTESNSLSSEHLNATVGGVGCDFGVCGSQVGMGAVGVGEELEEAWWKRQHTRLEDALHSLKSTLEDYQGQYTQLQHIECQVRALDRVIKRNSGAGSPRSSEVSISIETALNAFDFLEQEYYLDGYGSRDASRRSSLDQLEAKCTLSPESTTKTGDSGIESIARRLSEDRILETSLDSNPDGLSTGCGQVDTALLWHLQYAERLLENLGTYGPLKCKELYSIERLQRQGRAMEMLLGLAGESNIQLQQVVQDLGVEPNLADFWGHCVDGAALYCSAERFLSQLERHYGDMIREKYEVSATKVFKLVTARVLDLPWFDPESCRPCPTVTLFQLNYFMSDQPHSLRDLLRELGAEVWVNERLQGSDPDIVIKTVLTFRETLPPPPCLRTVALLLLADNHNVRNTAANYLLGVGRSSRGRTKCVVVYMESLEERSADLRRAACIALRLLQGSECMEQLVYVSHSDGSSIVKQQARDTLLSLGDEGRRAYEDSQLTVHGFQGVKVHL